MYSPALHYRCRDSHFARWRTAGGRAAPQPSGWRAATLSRGLPWLPQEENGFSLMHDCFKHYLLSHDRRFVVFPRSSKRS
eukprot:5402202-Pleurochrysis_carterae.AAC.1